MKDHSYHTHDESSEESDFKIAFQITLHCLLGCGLGEVAGMIIATAFGFNPVSKIVLALASGFFSGILLGIQPLSKAGFSVWRAFKTVLVTEGLSILVMLTAEVLLQVYTPGVIQAGLGDLIFWMGMGSALFAGFIAAFFVNYFQVKRGVRHWR